jgi:hypothetical protein
MVPAIHMAYDSPGPVLLLRADHLLAVKSSYVGGPCCVAEQDMLVGCTSGPARREYRLTVPTSLARAHHSAFQADALSNPLAITPGWHRTVGLTHATCRR